MSIATLVLYGSWARTDNSAGSDVDLFGIGVDADYRMIVANKVNLAVYAAESALEMCRAGDLFMLHLVREGRPIYDEAAFFDRMVSAFKFRESYRPDISKAAELGWALVGLAPTARNQALLNKRVAWCVRTILIAKAADEREAIFSAKQLAEFAGDRTVLTLVQSKEKPTLQPRDIELFAEFLRRSCGTETNHLVGVSIQESLDWFQRSGNVVGEKTLRGLLGEAVRDSYT